MTYIDKDESSVGRVTSDFIDEHQPRSIPKDF